MQTSSNPEFNSTFKDEKSLAHREAEKLGGIPNWPTVTEILNQAENACRCLLRRNKWLNPSRPKRHTALTTQERSDERPPKRQRTCFNCGSPDHLLPDCLKVQESDTNQ